MAEEVFVDTVVGRLKVTILGAGAPAVLWHSLFVDERSWERVAAELAQDRLLVLITGPGHGESSDPHRRYDLLECARAAGQALDALGVEGPVDWVGNAWGGHVGLRFAAAQPRRIRSLVTIGTPVQALATAERVQTRFLLLVHRVLGATGFLVDAVVETLLSPSTRENGPEAVALVRRSFLEADPRRLRNAVASISLRREDLAALLPRITIPTLMITGEQHSGWTPAQAAAAVATMPDGRAAVVADAAYLVPLERPDAVVAQVRDFWASALAEASGDQQ
jgi:pimeloyl-ACP methyl ester carboxylesterase